MSVTTRNYGAIRDAETAVKLLDRITERDVPFAFDIEAGYVGDDKEKVSLMQFHPDYRLVGVSFTDSSDWARYIPIGHDNGGNVDDVVPVARALWRLVRTGNGIAHNAAYEIKGLSRWFREVLWRDPEVGEDVRLHRGMFDVLADTMIMVWMSGDYHPTKVGKELKAVAKEAFGLEMAKFESLFPLVDSEFGPAMKRGKIRFARFNTRNSFHPPVISYACEDSVAAYMLWERYKDLYVGDQLYTVENELIPILVEMESGPIDEDGNFLGNVRFDWTLVRRKEAEASKFAKLMGEEILATLSERLGRVININLGSPKQLSAVLFEEAPVGLGLPVKQRSDKTQEPSTSDDALKLIAKSDPVIRRILEYRQIVKLNSSYLTKFINEFAYHPDGVVFPNHNQAGTVTGRMSVDQVSYQQWPKPYHFELDSGLTFDFSFRDILISLPPYRIVGYDYANVEMRIAGALSGEKRISGAFNSGQDLHRSTAAATFGVPMEEVTKKQRQNAKTLNFAILYGSGPAAIAESLSTPTEPMSKADAEKMLSDYLKGYPELANWIGRQVALARETKMVKTHFGRRFAVWDYYAPEHWQRAKGDRMAVNAPIQGTAADIIKLAMVRVYRVLKKRGLLDLIRMTLTVHDALEFLVHESISTKEVVELLEPLVNFNIPGFDVEIRADWHEGYQWGAVAEVKLDDHKNVIGYEMDHEVPWAGQSYHWEGTTLHETLDHYYTWEAETFGLNTDFYRTHNPDFLPLEVGPVAEAPKPAQSEQEPKVVTITLAAMPTRAGWSSFEEYVKARPGVHTVRVETPQGDVTLDGYFDLSERDQPEVSLMLGGARVSVASATVDSDFIFELAAL